MNSALKLEGTAKVFLKQAFADWRSRLKPGYEAILNSAPKDFVNAFRERAQAEWHPVVFDPRYWPQFDDDNEHWYEVMFYFDYRTEAGRLYAVLMEADKDGSHDFVAEAEVGTPEAEELERDYGFAGWAHASRHYWEWVLANKEDPLHYVRVPRVEVKQHWLAAFVRQGLSLRLYAIRQLTEQKPSPPAVQWPEVVQKARTDAGWKEALDYCLVNEEGVTEATEKDMFGDEDLDARWDGAGRLLVNFVTTREEESDTAQEAIEKAARGAWRELRTHLGEGAAKKFLQELTPEGQLQKKGFAARGRLFAREFPRPSSAVVPHSGYPWPLVLGTWRRSNSDKWEIGVWLNSEAKGTLPEYHYGVVDARVIAPVMVLMANDLKQMLDWFGDEHFGHGVLMSLRQTTAPYREDRGR